VGQKLPMVAFQEKVRNEVEPGQERTAGPRPPGTTLRNTTLTDGTSLLLFSYDHFKLQPEGDGSTVRLQVPALGNHVSFTAGWEDARRLDQTRYALVALLRRFAARPEMEASQAEFLILTTYWQLLENAFNASNPPQPQGLQPGAQQGLQPGVQQNVHCSRGLQL